MRCIRMALLIGLFAMPGLVAAQSYAPTTPVLPAAAEASAPPVPLRALPRDGMIDPQMFSCRNIREIEASVEYPAKALRLKLPARVTIRIHFVVAADGEFRDIAIESPPDAGYAFNDTANAIMKRLKCVNHMGQDQPVIWPIDFVKR